MIYNFIQKFHANYPDPIVKLLSVVFRIVVLGIIFDRDH